MSKDDDLKRLHKALITDWALSEGARPSMKQLLEELSRRVQELLDTDMNRLTTAMYTLDIDEERFGEAMGVSDIETKSMGVAELILEREMQKIETRMQYEAMKRRKSDDQAADSSLPESPTAIDLD